MGKTLEKERKPITLHWTLWVYTLAFFVYAMSPIVPALLSRDAQSNAQLLGMGFVSLSSSCALAAFFIWLAIRVTGLFSRSPAAVNTAGFLVVTCFFVMLGMANLAASKSPGLHDEYAQSQIDDAAFIRGLEFQKQMERIQSQSQQPIQHVASAPISTPTKQAVAHRSTMALDDLSPEHRELAEVTIARITAEGKTLVPPYVQAKRHFFDLGGEDLRRMFSATEQLDQHIARCNKVIHRINAIQKSYEGMGLKIHASLIRDGVPEADAQMILANWHVLVSPDRLAELRSQETRCFLARRAVLKHLRNTFRGWTLDRDARISFTSDQDAKRYAELTTQRDDELKQLNQLATNLKNHIKMSRGN